MRRQRLPTASRGPRNMRLLALGLSAMAGLLVARAAMPTEVDALRARWVEASYALADAEIRAGRLDAAARCVEAAAATLPAEDRSPVIEARLALAQARVLLYRDFILGPPSDPALDRLRAALASAERAGDEALLATARDQLALALFLRNFRASDHAEARELLGSALATRRRSNDGRGIAETLFHLGLTHENRREPGSADRELARRLYEESLVVAETGGFEYEASYAIRHLAGLREEAGDLAGARAGFERSLDLRRRADATLVLAPALTALADVLAKLGEADRARSLYEEALATAQRIGSPAFAEAARDGLANLER